MIDKNTKIGTLVRWNESNKSFIVRYDGDSLSEHTIFHDKYFKGTVIQTDIQQYFNYIGLEDDYFQRQYFDPVVNKNESKPKCNHKFVNVSFNQIKMECLYCGQPE